MKKIIITTGLSFFLFFAKSQTMASSTDSNAAGTITVVKDPRLDELAKKEAEFNVQMTVAPKTARGYRLLLLSTNDRPMAMKVRTTLLQRYPDQKVYMSFLPPNIKLKFGNYIDRSEAENMKKEILREKLVTSNIYIVPETIEIKPEKPKEKEADN